MREVGGGTCAMVAGRPAGRRRAALSPGYARCASWTVVMAAAVLNDLSCAVWNDSVLALRDVVHPPIRSEL